VGVRFFAHVQTGPGAHPASCTVGTGSFPGVKRPGRGADHPLPSSVPRSRKSRAIPLPFSGPSALLRGTFTFYLEHAAALRCFLLTEHFQNRFMMMCVYICTNSTQERPNITILTKQTFKLTGKYLLRVHRTLRAFSP
jgi:hypothetical protein